MKELQMDVLYAESPGGEHTLFISKNQDILSKIFFFNIVRKNQRAAANKPSKMKLSPRAAWRRQ